MFTSASIECAGKASCRETSFTIKGNYPNGGQMNTSDVETDAFVNSDLDVELTANQIFELNCGENLNDKNCESITFRCFGGMCSCVGGCHGLMGGIIVSS